MCSTSAPPPNTRKNQNKQSTINQHNCPITTCHAPFKNLATHLRGCHKTYKVNPGDATLWDLHLCSKCDSPYSTAHSRDTHSNKCGGTQPLRLQGIRPARPPRPRPQRAFSVAQQPPLPTPDVPPYVTHPAHLGETAPPYLHREWMDVCRVALTIYERDRSADEEARTKAIYDILMIPYRSLKRVRGGVSGRTTHRRNVAAALAHMSDPSVQHQSPVRHLHPAHTHHRL
jgi:hypothetical protein